MPRTVLWRQDFAVIEGVSVVNGYDVVACDACGMTFADRLPGQPVFDHYYRETSKYEFPQRGGAESAHDAARLAITADAIATLVPDRAARVLDVGCATGRLLSELRARGFGDLHGVDPSSACVAAARSRYGVAAEQATIADLAGRPGEYDLIVVVGVLEHLVDLQSALGTLSSRIRPGGALYMEVPDVTGFADWPNAPFQEFSVEHVNFFSPTSLSRALHESGFGIVWTERNTREQSSGTTVPNLAGLFRKGDIAALAPNVDIDSAAAVRRYVARCTAEERQLLPRIDALVASQEPVIVWGTGTHALRLLATSALSRAHIVAFVDSNVRYQGRKLCGRDVCAPSLLHTRSEPILIASKGFVAEICAQILAEFGRARRLWPIHSDQELLIPSRK